MSSQRSWKARPLCHSESAAGRVGCAEESARVGPLAPSTPPRIAFLRTITVEGFRGIGLKATLDLTPGPGLTLVVGRNGCGNSSFAEGLELLLTGDTYRWRDRSGIWRDGWLPKRCVRPSARARPAARRLGGHGCAPQDQHVGVDVRSVGPDDGALRAVGRSPVGRARGLRPVPGASGGPDGSTRCSRHARGECDARRGSDWLSALHRWADRQ